MKRTFFCLFIIFLSYKISFAQENYWRKTNIQEEIETTKAIKRNNFPEKINLFELETIPISVKLMEAPQKKSARQSQTIISLPTTSGTLESYRVYQFSNFHPELQQKYPGIRSFVGVGVDDPKAVVRLSLSHKGIQAMVFRSGKRNEFIEPYSKDRKIYAVYHANRVKGKLPFVCSTPDHNVVEVIGTMQRPSSSSEELLDFRLAMSCNGEYTQYHGGRIVDALAGINATMTRVNGIFERDFAVHMTLISNNDEVIYTNSSTDPYSSMGNWNSELQNALTNVIGESNYDVGHMFGASGGGGNAGCIGCVCVDGQKGSGITSPADGIPEGDAFDVDYVAHELGHQFGANHTFSSNNEGTGVNMEPGSGSTIMGYAGITNQDVQVNSDDHFHAASIYQVQANMVGKTCPTRTPLNNTAPIVDAGANYTIPKSTPFVLEGTATDPDHNTLTYCWEQYDNASQSQTGTSSAASSTKSSGPNWRSYSPKELPFRYFPPIERVLDGQTTTNSSEIIVEALSSVSRTLNFRLTVRDQVIGAGQTNYDDTTITVDANYGPLIVTSQNTSGISWAAGSTQNISWDVNSTNQLSGASNVDILLSTDGGYTFDTVLASDTPNDGSESITVPDLLAADCRVMVKASSNVFFNVNSESFAVGGTVVITCDSYEQLTTVDIPDGSGANSAGATITSSIDYLQSKSISDVNVSVDVSHTYIQDLRLKLTHSDGTEVILWNRNCEGENNFDLIFDDQGTNVSCANDMTGNHIPIESLSRFNSKDSQGTWVLSLADFYNGDSGKLNNWSLEICSTELSPLANHFYDLLDFNLYPNPNNGEFIIEFTPEFNKTIEIDVFDSRGRLVFNQSYTSSTFFKESIDLSDFSSGVYIAKISNGEKHVSRKVIIN